MVNSCCIPIDLLSNEFVTNVYKDPDSKQYNCPVCGEDISKELASTIITNLREKATNLSFKQVVQLRAAFWSLVDQYHGYCPPTCFNIVEVEVSPGILATVRPEGGKERQLAVSKAKFLEMVEDPSLAEGDGGQIYAKLTGPVQAFK
jgi:hypothetical protein